uniref:NADH-ubiquinone oxidoreductase chain 5 n=1 Tax=Anthaxia sp. ANT01 TaxID=1205539 RepID=A0A0S2MRL7_9COLE|nr:NADH deshydrogenase subunit 5 [Anthaxia sp. ANT01]
MINLSICMIFFHFFFSKNFLFFSSLFFMASELSYFLEFEILNINSNMICMILLFDWMSLLFMSFVLFISSMVIFYSEEYMMGDLNLHRFIMLVMMFVLSMMMMILSPNLISILLGWDGLGLVSYCLVIYYQNVKSYNAGMLTALSNRVGDVAILMTIAWMLNYGSWNFLFYLQFMKTDFSMQLISILIVLAAMTKSAQIPFSAWLPAAMAAPTPVSSLVHSSTLVTAGVYLLIRFYFSLNSFVLMVLLFVSVMTMFMSGLGANFEFDLKKIIALSTLSQLGFMMSILCLGEFMLAYYHMLTHALFKALLFMCAGSIIHSLNNCQDIRYMGGLSLQMPLTLTMFFIANLSLCGLPFLSGFYSKDLILEFFSMSNNNIIIYLMYYISTGLTVSYTFRLLYYTMFGSFNYLALHSINDTSYKMLGGMLGLVITVVIGGSFLSWLMFPIPYFICLPFCLKFMTFFVIFIGAWLGYQLSSFSLGDFSWSMLNINLSSFFSSMWNLPYISTLGVNFYPLLLGLNYFKMIDHGWLEFLGSQKIYLNIRGLSQYFHFLYNNSLKIYLMMLVIWIIILFMIIL